MAIAQTDEEIKDEVVYFDTLYDFTSVISRLNNKAFDGVERNALQKNFCKLIPAFTLLCGVDAEDSIDITNVGTRKKCGRPKKKEQEPTPEPKQEEPEQLPENFLKENEGWGLCPVCGKKMVRLTGTTKLVDFPAFCKSCKDEYLVSWWNVDAKAIEYTEYTRPPRRITREDIRHEALKGAGLRSYSNTRTSATERVAMNLR